MNAQPAIPLEEAFRTVDETLGGPPLAGETVPVREAAGRVLLCDQVSVLDLPPFDKAAMDGYAVLADDVREEYRLLETIAAGGVGTARLVGGCCVKIMTGAAVPVGAGRVIPVEQAEEFDGVVKVRRPEHRSHICRRAEDVRCGQKILSAGTILGPLEVANLLSGGIPEIEVVRRVRVAIISTGDELVDCPKQLTPGKIVNSNGPMLAGLADEFGLTVVSEGILPDDRAATVRGIRAALEEADVVAISGGVSAGDLDFVPAALGDAGLEVHFSRVAVKPGAPMTYACGRRQAVFGLPGNPVTAYLMFHLFVLRAVERLTGSRPFLREYDARLDGDFERRKTQRVEYVPCRLVGQGRLEPVEFHGSAHLAALLEADGFFVVEVGRAKISAGEEVVFVPMGHRHGPRGSS
jgi:molybdopterin molybdotransferase